MSKMYKPTLRILAAALSMVLLIQGMPWIGTPSFAAAATFDAYRTPIRYEMEDFYGTDKWYGSSAEVTLGAPESPTSANGSVASGSGEASICFGAVGDAMTLTLEDIPVSGEYLVYISARPVEQNPKVYLRKDADSSRVSEPMRMRSAFGGDGNSYYPRTLKTEGVMRLARGTDTIDIVCEAFSSSNPTDAHKKLRVDYIEIRLVGGQGVILTPAELQPIATSNETTFSKEKNSDADTAWGNITGAFYKLGNDAKVGSRIDFPLTDLEPGEYYIKYAYKPRSSGTACVFQTLADGEKIGEPVDQTAGSNTVASPNAATTSNIQTPDPIGIVTVPENGEVTISLEATAVNGTGALVLLRMWLYPVAGNTQIMDGLIADIPDLVSETDEAFVRQIKQLYDGMSDAEQAAVTDVNRLEQALKVLDGETLDSAVTAVILQITALPDVDNMTLEDEEALQAAGEAYAALTDAQKQQVTNRAKLTGLQARMIDLLAADAVTKMIDQLPEANAITTADRAKVTEAKAAYEKLTAEGQALVLGVQKLNRLSTILQVLDVQTLIENLPTVDAVTAEDLNVVLDAQKAYNDLGNNQYLVEEELAQKLIALLTRLGVADARYGDVNRDGVLDIADVLVIRAGIRDGMTGDALENADLNGSGKLDAQDAEWLLRLLSIKAGDMNNNGQVTTDDVNTLSDYVLKGDADDTTMAVGDLNSDGKLDIHDLMAVRDGVLHEHTGTYSTNAAGVTVYSETVKDPADTIQIQVMGGDRVKARGVDSLSYGTYFPGDIVSITAEKAYFWVQLTETLGEALVYAPTGNFSFQIPFDDPAADATGFAPGAFRDAANVITARLATDEEVQAEQNLAVNAYDFRYLNEETQEDDSVSVKQGEVRAYPHAYAGCVLENDPVNGARTAIDGVRDAGFAWDSGQYDDSEYVLYFGREVTVEQINLILRDEETDTYWKSVTIQFSDGSEHQIPLTGPKSELGFEGIPTTYIRLQDLVCKDSSADLRVALEEIEVVGRNTHTENPAAVKTGVAPYGLGSISKALTNQYKAADVAAVLKKVQQTYEKDNLYLSNKVWDNCWFEAVYHTGLLEAYMTTGDPDYYLSSNQFAESLGYMVVGTENTAHADWFAVGQNFMTLYELSPYNQTKLTDIFTNIDWLADRAVLEENATPLDFWWCDAFYMGGVIFTKATNLTGDPKYAQAEHNAYLHWRDKLYNPQYQLWARDDRFVAEVREDDRFAANEKISAPTGVPIFWARGNGWVMGYLAQQLTNIKDKDSEIYKTLAADFKELAAGVKAVQREDGTWNSSMADPDYYAGPEATGTAGFLYAFSVGMSLGLLDKNEYMPATIKAYEALTGLCQISDGKIGYMQQPGDRPSEYVSEEFTRKRTETYGMGLFYMGLSAFMRLCEDYEAPLLEIPMDNQVAAFSRYAKEEGYYTGTVTATAASQESSNTAQKAFDKYVSGSGGVRWTPSTRGFVNDWIIGDLGKEVALEQINVHMLAGRDYQYKIEVSTDQVNWVTVADRTDNIFTMIYQQNKFEPIYARYVRLTVTGTGGTYTGNTTSISEIMLYEYTGDGAIRRP